mmetsp:Transcript_142232/g.247979  ORF Transcript_142232/g.247979 Transcript_142232/m.247979 type:complete len:1069 (+) Transcript_142232:135-3341(+)
MSQVLPSQIQEVLHVTPKPTVNGEEPSSQNGSVSVLKAPPSAPPRAGTRSDTYMSSSDSVWSKDHAHLDADARLWQAVKMGNVKRATEALDDGGNPNAHNTFDQLELWDFHHMSHSKRNSTQLKGKLYTGSIVSAAVIKNDIDMLRLLAERGGSRGRAALTGPESFYKFKAGLRKVDFEAPPTFANTKGEVKIMRVLVQCKADLHEKARLEGRENTTLLWSASYSGHKKLVQWLLENTEQHCLHQLEESCAHQDDSRVTHTPLHIASRQGHVEVVRILLHKGAQFKRHNEEHMTPLTDAIDYNHAAVVRELVEHLADPLSSDAERWLFGERNNMVTINAAADGMRRAMLANPGKFHEMFFKTTPSHPTPRLNIRNVVKFLHTPGDALIHIMIVIFQKRMLRYRMYRKTDDGCGITQRRTFKNAHIPENAKFNVAVGPDVAYWNRKFEEELPRADESGDFKTPQDAPARDISRIHQEHNFKKRLLPQHESHQMRHHRKENTPMQVPIDIYQCVLRGIHKNPEVLFAIAEQQGDAVFKAYSIQAIVELGWLDIRWRYNIHLFNAILLVLLLIYMAWKINNDGGPIWYSVVARIMMYCCWIVGLSQEVGQIMGHWLLGRLEGYVTNLWNYLDWARLVLTFLAITMLMVDMDAFKCNEDEEVTLKYTLYRSVFAVVVFFRWMRVLNALRGYKTVGNEMLPITTAFYKIYPFFGVVTVPFLGFSHAYYCFGIYGDQLFRTVSIVYRLGFVGDFDVEEMEDVDGTYTVEDGVHVFEDPEKTNFFNIVRLFLIVCSAFMTVIMMNLMIGVLSEAYNESRMNSEEIFWKTRARIVFDELALREAMRLIRMRVKMCCCCCCGRRKGVRIEDKVEERFSNETNESGMDAYDNKPKADDDSEWDYVWYCCQAEGAAAAADGAIDDSANAVTQKDFDEIKEQMSTTVMKMNHLMMKQHHQMVEEIHRFGSGSERPMTAPNLVSEESGIIHSARKRFSEPSNSTAFCVADSVQVGHTVRTPRSAPLHAEGPQLGCAVLRSVPFAAESQKALTAVQQTATTVAEGAWNVVESGMKQAKEITS